jgi:tripartite-type tricarboxylate transporter receptor subunit TctC
MKKLIAGLVLLATSLASFAQWPTKNVTLIVPFQPGGLAGQISLALQQHIEEKHNVKAIPKFMPGSGSMVAVNHVLSDSNDNHTIVIFTNDFFTSQVYQKQTLYDQFVPVNVMTQFGGYVFGSSNSSVVKLKNDINNNRPINIGTLGVGSGYDLWARQLTHPNLVLNPIPYNGSSPMVANILGGHLDYGIGIGVVSTGQSQDERIKLLMYSGSERNSVYKDVPTFKELGFGGEPYYGLVGWFARKDTPPEVVNEISKVLTDFVNTSPVFKLQAQQGMTVVNLDPHQSIKVVQESINRTEKMLNR